MLYFKQFKVKPTIDFKLNKFQKTPKRSFCQVLKTYFIGISFTFETNISISQIKILVSNEFYEKIH